MWMTIEELCEQVEQGKALLVRQGNRIDAEIGTERTFMSNGKIYVVLAEVSSKIGSSLDDTGSSWMHLFFTNKPKQKFDATKPKHLNEPSQPYTVYDVKRTT